MYSDLEISYCKGDYGQYAGIMEGSMKTYEKIERIYIQPRSLPPIILPMN